MGSPSGVNDALLRAICKLGGHRAGAVVDVRPIADQVDADRPRLFRAIVELVDDDLLEYVGAGPRVRVTELGAHRCGHPQVVVDPGPAGSAV